MSDQPPPVPVLSREALKFRVEVCGKMLGAMCHDERGPKMSIPPREDDEDLYLSQTFDFLLAAVEDRHPGESDVDRALRHTKEAGDEMYRALHFGRDRPVPTY